MSSSRTGLSDSSAARAGGQSADGLTVRAALAEAAARFGAAGIEGPQLDAQVLLAHVLGVNRAWLLGNPEAALTRRQAQHWARLVALREGRRPAAYLTGRREFYGREFQVDRRVLVPRPETELLVERAVEVARAWRAERGAWPRVADIGTGSGAIAVSVAAELPALPSVVAVDASLRALNVAEANARRHGVAERVEFRLGDLLLPLTEPVDVVLANLPYVEDETIAALAPEVRFEPRMALEGGADGLDLIRRLLAQVPEAVRPGGMLLLEIGAGQGEAAARLAEGLRPRSVEVRRDYAGYDRLVEVWLGKE